MQSPRRTPELGRTVTPSMRPRESLRDQTPNTQVTVEERCAYAVSSRDNWKEDWAPHEMREACAARAKPGQVLGPDSVCPGLRLGHARLRSAVLRGSGRDGFAGLLGEGSGTAECPCGLRGPVVGVVMSHERTRGSVIKDDRTYEHLDIFQVFYQNGQSEELELEEIAACFEPRQDMSDAPEGLSAPELARCALRAKGIAVGETRYEAPKYVPPPGAVAERVARNARLYNSVNHLRKGASDVAPACYRYVADGGTYNVDDLLNGARLVTRIPEGAQGADGLENLEVLAAATGAVSKRRLSAAIPAEVRRSILFLALDVKLRLLGFDAFAFTPSVEDLCLDTEEMNDKFEEFEPAPPSRAAVKRVVLDLVALNVSTLPPFERGNFRTHLLEELRRELPLETWNSREGDVVWVSRRDWVDSRRLALAPDDPTSSLLVERSACIRIGQKCRRRWLEYGLLEGVVEEGAGPDGRGNFAKYRVRWDGAIDDWYAARQVFDYVVNDGPVCREDLVPCVVVPPATAHFEGGELLLYAVARKGCTIWHRGGRRPYFPCLCLTAPTPDFPSTRRRCGVPATAYRGNNVDARPPHALNATQVRAGRGPSTSPGPRCGYSLYATATATSSRGTRGSWSTRPPWHRHGTRAAPTRTPQPCTRGGGSCSRRSRPRGRGSPRAPTASSGARICRHLKPAPADGRASNTTAARRTRRRRARSHGPRRRRATPRSSSSGRRSSR